jgi:hypothetical protein
MPPTEHELTWTCVTCSHANTDAFCSHCGEKRHDGHQSSLRHMLSETLEAFFHLDSKIFLSLRTLLTKPGQLTAEYFRGRRKPYMAPLQLFLVCNFLFFVLQPFTGLEILAPPLRSFEHNSVLQNIALPMIDHRLQQKHLSRSNPEQYAAFTEQFDHTSRLQAKTLILAMVPMLALLLTVVYARPLFSRTKRYFVEHLVFSLHAYAWWLLWILAILVVMALLYVLRLISARTLDATATLLEFPGFGLYLFLALRRYYQGKLWQNVLRGILLTFGVLGIFELYRIMLLFTILRAT